MDGFCTMPQAIEQIKAGKMLIVVDDPLRENQGDLFFPAATVDTEKVNLMIQECRGLVCVPVTRENAVRLDLPLMVEPVFNTEKHGCSFTVSIDAQTVTAFGISASDRAKTIQTMIDPVSKPTDFVRPGHIFPLQAHAGGVLQRAGHTEASIELAELAGFPPYGVICEILNDNGEPSNQAELRQFSKRHSIPMVTIADLIAYKKTMPKTMPKRVRTIMPIAESLLPTQYGTFQIHIYKSIIDNREHAALVLKDDHFQSGPVLTRVHSKCFTGDTLSSLRCDCNAQLHQSMEMIQKNRQGVLIYLDQEGRGIGLGNKIKAYALQDQGYDTVEANHMLGLPTDARDYQIAVEILNELGVNNINLLTNNPEKEKELSKLGVHIDQSIPLETQPNDTNIAYLKTKKRKLGHRLTSI